MSTSTLISPELLENARAFFANHHPLSNDLQHGSFFDDPTYLDSLPRDAQTFACAIAAVGVGPDLPAVCHTTSGQKFRTYLQRNNEDLLTTSMAMEAIALRFVPPEDPGRGKSNHHMGQLFQKKWETTKRPESLDQAIRHYQLAVEHAVEEDYVVGCWACDVGVMLSKRYFVGFQYDDVDAAEVWFECAIALVGDSPYRMAMLSNKGDFLRFTSFENGREHEARINQSLVYHKQAIELCDTYLKTPRRMNLPFPMVFYNASQSYLARFHFTSEEGDIASATLMLERASGLQPTNELSKIELGNAYLARGEKLKDTNDIYKACSIWEAVIKENPTSVIALVALGDCYRKQGLQISNRELSIAKIEQAVSWIEQAVTVMPATQEDSGYVYHQCSLVHYSKYGIDGDPADVDRAIECSRLAIARYANRRPWSYYSILSQLLLKRYNILNQGQDLADAFHAAEEGIRLCGGSRSHGALSECKWVYGQALRRQYDQNLDPSLLQKAIDTFNEAKGLMPDTSSFKSLLLNDLGNAYAQNFKHTSSPENLDKGIDALRESLNIMRTMNSSELHPDVLMINNSLGSIMLQRYQHWKGEADLKASVSYYRKSLTGIDPSHPRYVLRAGNLSGVLQLLFQVNGDVRQLLEAQSYAQSALSGPQTLSDETKTWLETQIGDAFCLAYDKTKQLSDLQNAIEHYDNALAPTGISLTYRATTMTNRAVALMSKAEATGSPEDFQKSYQAFEEVRQILTKDSPIALVNLRNQANLAFEMYNRKIGPDYEVHGLRALEKFKSAAQNPLVTPGRRIDASLAAASLMGQLKGDAAEARDLICIGLKLLPEAVLMHASRLEQLDFIRKYHSLPSSATALSLKANDPVPEIIQRLEASRAIIWDRLLDERTPVQAFKNLDAHLVEKFRILQRNLFQQPSSSTNLALLTDLSSISPNDELRLKREHDSHEYKRLLQEMRQLNLDDDTPALEGSKNLQQLTANAPIVFINASVSRSDALIIPKGDDPFHIPLPNFGMEMITQQGARFLLSLERLSSKNAEVISEGFADYKAVMKWLWESAAKPILDKIDFSGYPLGPANKPHIKWVATGWASFYPIHAAGDFTQSESQSSPSCVHDCVVSSYTTSLKALTFARRNETRFGTELDLKNHRALAVAMGTTPGLGKEQDLNVEPEIQSFKDLLGSSMQVQILRQKDSKTVKDQLQTSYVALFTCHAKADEKDPSKSAILLQDCARYNPTTRTNEIRDAQPFCVRTILKLDLQQCRLIHLSACKTAMNKDLSLRDEGIHIAGGFHMAGVPHVISTLWRVAESVSTELTSGFYKYLKNGDTQLHVDRSADALHMAIQQLRNRGVEPMLWGPFIHSGP